MATLPNITAVGIARPRSGTGIVNLQGGELVGGAVRDFAREAEATALGIQKEIIDSRNKLQYAQARSEFLRQEGEIKRSFESDNDYGTFEQRYQEAIKKVNQDVSNKISSPSLRKLTATEFDILAESGRNDILDLVSRKEKDVNRASLAEMIDSNRQAALKTTDPNIREDIFNATKLAIDAARESGYLDNVEAQNAQSKFREDYGISHATILEPYDRIKALEATKNAPDWVKHIPEDKRIELIRSAKREIQSRQTTLKSGLEQRIKDANAMALQGEEDPSPLQLDDFIGAYGEEGPKRFSEFQEMQVYAKDVNYLSLATPEEQQELLERNKPIPGEGFAEKQKRYEIMAKAVTDINTQRIRDPMGFALGNQMAQPLDLTDPESVAGQLKERAGLAEAMKNDYGVPFTPLSKAEAAGLASGLAQKGAKDKMDYLRIMQNSMSDSKSYQAIMRQIAPDSPVTAMAGAYIDLGTMQVDGGFFGKDTTIKAETVAQRLLVGDAAINPNKVDKDNGMKAMTMPSDKDMRAEFTTRTEDLFKNYPQGQQQAYNSVKAYYAALAVEKGDYSGELDIDAFDQSVQDVLGNISDVNGNGNVLLPWGMDESDFADKMESALSTQKLNYNVNYRDVGFENTGTMGKYMVKSGESYLMDSQGKPLIIDINAEPLQVPLAE